MFSNVKATILAFVLVTLQHLFSSRGVMARSSLNKYELLFHVRKVSILKAHARRRRAFLCCMISWHR